MREIDYDLCYFKLLNLFSHKCGKEEFKRIYQKANENLSEILKITSFKNKNVLTVLSSSDQYFSAYYLGANNVDTFDINMTTFFYHFLRKWYLLYYNEPFIEDKKSKLLNCLEAADTLDNNEVEIRNIWEKLIKKFGTLKRIFYLDNSNGTIPYGNDIKLLTKIIKKRKINFECFDLYQYIPYTKKYDIIYLSNILELIPIYEVDELRLAKNLNNILNDNGIIIGTSLSPKLPEIDAFYDYFSYNAKETNININAISYCYTYKKERR